MSRVGFALLLSTLLAAPAGPRVVMGLDPGIRTGVKVAVQPPGQPERTEMGREGSVGGAGDDSGDESRRHRIGALRCE